MPTPQQIHIRVRSNSRTKDVAGAIAHIIRGLPLADGNAAGPMRVLLSAIGPQAVNQAVKAVALANHFLYLDGLGLFVRPEFSSACIQGQERTSINLVLYTTRLALTLPKA